MSAKKNKITRLNDRVLTIAVVCLAVALVVLLWVAASLGDPVPTEPSTSPTTQPAPSTQTPTTQPTNATDPAETPEPTQTTEPTDSFLPLDLGDGLVITDMGPYTGAFMEDGSDEVVSRIMMIVLENTTDKALQYAQLTLDYGDTQAHFSITTVPAGQRVVLLESDRMPYTPLEPQSTSLENMLFAETLELYPDLFEITGDKGVLTVKNISQEPILGDIFVYYKNSSQDLLYGGITYRARVEGGLAPGESKRVLAAHYSPTGSVILMVTYVP